MAGSGDVERLADKHQTTIVLNLTLGEAVGERMETVTEDANGEGMGGARITLKLKNIVYYICPSLLLLLLLPLVINNILFIV